MPCVSTRNSGLCCQPACPWPMGFFVMDRSTTQDLCVCRSGWNRCIGAPCSMTSRAFTRSRLCLATRSRPIVGSKCARSSQNPLCCCVCLARCPRYNPHRQTALLHPAL
jgi:hypothetical protein